MNTNNMNTNNNSRFELSTYSANAKTIKSIVNTFNSKGDIVKSKMMKHIEDIAVLWRDTSLVVDAHNEKVHTLNATTEEFNKNIDTEVDKVVLKIKEKIDNIEEYLYVFKLVSGYEGDLYQIGFSKYGTIFSGIISILLYRYTDFDSPVDMYEQMLVTNPDTGEQEEFTIEDLITPIITTQVGGSEISYIKGKYGNDGIELDTLPLHKQNSLLNIQKEYIKEVSELLTLFQERKELDIQRKERTVARKSVLEEMNISLIQDAFKGINFKQMKKILPNAYYNVLFVLLADDGTLASEIDANVDIVLLLTGNHTLSDSRDKLNK